MPLVQLVPPSLPSNYLIFLQEGAAQTLMKRSSISVSDSFVSNSSSGLT